MATNGERERLRLFVALDLPQDVREALLAWRSVVVREVPELRLVGKEALHATLCFLGSQPADGVKKIAGACETALSGVSCPELGLQGGLWLPARRPRVLGVRLDDSSGGLGRIQEAVCAALSDEGWYTPEKRPFLPHVTVARVPAHARVRAAELPPLQSLRFRAPAVTLYRSRLQRSGARYEPLASIALNYRGRAA